MGLTVRTRGNATPRGKSRVMVSCHEKDRYVLEEIYRDILTAADCAIYTRDSEEPVPDALEEIQLLVVLISRRLLSEECLARQELRDTLDRGAPVLPIFLETGISRQFWDLFGSIQCLDRAKKDESALEYPEKLKRHLDAILVGGSLVSRVRREFDGYIFLSYRKQDRKQANQLMNLIHENDFARDIAIWYDEYLVPGENFDNSIRDALEKCQIFALSMTPSITQDENYVLLHEYPMAREQNKKLLPVMMSDTDREEIREKFPGLPECADPRDLTRRLMEQIRNLPRREDPQHLYYMGIAYLTGIDVEMNKTRGADLITRAAEGGWPEAVAKLADMYRTGDGVKQDPQKELSLREKKVIMSAPGEDPGDEDLRRWAEDMAYLAVCRYEAGDSEGAISCLLRASHRLLPVPELQGMRGFLLRLLAEYYEQKGDRELSVTTLEESLTILRRQPGAANRLVLAKGSLRLGQQYKEMGNPALAAKSIQDAEAAARQLWEERGLPEARPVLVMALQRLALNCWEAGETKKAAEYFRVCADHGEEMVRDSSDVRSYRLLADSLRMLGSLSSDPIPVYERSRQIAAKLAEDTGEQQDRRRLSEVCTYLGEALVCLGRREEAAGLCLEAWNSWDPRDEKKIRLGFTAGKLLTQLGSFDRAMPVLKDCSDLSTVLFLEDRAIPPRLNGEIHRYLGKCAWELQDKEEAFTAWDSALQTFWMLKMDGTLLPEVEDGCPDEILKSLDALDEKLKSDRALDGILAELRLLLGVLCAEQGRKIGDVEAEYWNPGYTGALLVAELEADRRREMAALVEPVVEICRKKKHPAAAARWQMRRKRLLRPRWKGLI